MPLPLPLNETLIMLEFKCIKAGFPNMLLTLAMRLAAVHSNRNLFYSDSSVTCICFLIL